MSTRQLLRIATAGSVDDGKSTLIGRLLHDTDSLPLDHLDAVTDDDGVADLAALSDGLRAEREQGITIDVAYRFFSTEARSYILGAIAAGADVTTGRGHGPLNHGYAPIAQRVFENS